MDIQVSSNFERLLFELNGRDGGMTAEQLRRFRATGRLDGRGRPAATQWIARVFRGAAVRRRRRRWTIIARTCTPRPGMLVDPHTAVGLGAAARPRASRRVPMVAWPPPTRPSSPTRSSAATGVRPALPAHLADLLRAARAHRPSSPTTWPRSRPFVARHGAASLTRDGRSALAEPAASTSARPVRVRTTGGWLRTILARAEGARCRSAARSARGAASRCWVSTRAPRPSARRRSDTRPGHPHPERRCSSVSRRGSRTLGSRGQGPRAAARHRRRRSA